MTQITVYYTSMDYPPHRFTPYNPHPSTPLAILFSYLTIPIILPDRGCGVRACLHGKNERL